MPILPLHQTAGAQLAWLSLLPGTVDGAPRLTILAGTAQPRNQDKYQRHVLTLPQPPKCPKASGAIKQDQKRNKPAGRKNNGKIIDTQHSQDECWNLLESYSTLNLYRVKTIKTYKKISHLSFILITIPSCSLERCLIFWTQDKASKTGNICKSLSTQTRNSNHFIQPEPEGQDSKKIKNSRRWQFSPSPELSLIFSKPIPGS